MSSTARTEAECKEFFDDAETLKKKIKQLAELVKNSKHFAVFTGAGISTAAGIADFRSGINTVLDTGAGKWAKSAAVKEGKKKEIKKAKVKKDSFKAIPTAAHMSLVELMNKGYLKCVISQNTDGLHRRSGIPLDFLAELHGNRTMEWCKDKCGKEYMRDFCCRKSIRKQKTHDHWAGRYCSVPKCEGKLYDTIINFGESLPDEPFTKGKKNTKQCDLMLSLGSSLTVSPACHMPRDIGLKWKREIKDNKKDIIIKHNLCIVNLQKTGYDDMCSVRIFAKIDDVMIGLMNELNLTIPKFYLNRFVKIKIQEIENRNDLRKCIVYGVDIDGINASVFTGVKLRNNGQKLLKINNIGNSGLKQEFRPDEYVFNIPNKLEIKESDGDVEEKKSDKENDVIIEKKVDKNKGLVVELTFYEHYNEPKLLIQLNDYLTHFSDAIYGEIVLRLVYDLGMKKWIVKGKDEQEKDNDIGKLWIVESQEKNDKNQNDNNDTSENVK